MATAFISYARQDLSQALSLEKMLLAAGVKVWRDQDSIYAGENWPQAIGAGIAAQDGLILLWSQAAAQSHFVAFEWNTAIALKKTIIPIFLDSTPLPPALAAKNGVWLNTLPAGLSQLLAGLKIRPKAAAKRKKQVLAQLAELPASPPEQVLKKATAWYDQKGWSIQGNVYQVTGSGDLHVNVTQVPTPAPVPQKWWEKWQTRLAFALTILTLITLSLDLPEKIARLFEKPPPVTQETVVLKGIVTDTSGMPIEGVTISLDRLPGDTVRTTSDGTFVFRNVPGKIGDQARIYARADRYQSRNEFKTLPGPVRIELEEK